MKLATIILAAGLNTTDFPITANKLVDVFDQKHKSIPDGEFTFSEPIFSQNPSSLERFSKFLKRLENDNTLSTMSIRFDENELVILFGLERLVLPRH